jgi:hypothetical protein
VSLDRIGDVLVAQGDLAGARARFSESLAIRQRLAAADPSSAILQRDVLVSLFKLAQMPNSGVRWAQVLVQGEDMQRRGVLSPRDGAALEQIRALAAKERGQ